MAPYDDKIELFRIAIHDPFREQGHARGAMEQLCALADTLGLTIVLSPADDWGSSVPRLKRFTSGALGLMRRHFHRVLEKHGCRTTGHFAGFQITGRFRTAELVQLLEILPEGSTELMCHPGHCGEALRAAPTRLKESREHELAALVAPETRAAVERNGIEVVSYAGLG